MVCFTLLLLLITLAFSTYYKFNFHRFEFLELKTTEASVETRQYKLKNAVVFF